MKKALITALFTLLYLSTALKPALANDETADCSSSGIHACIQTSSAQLATITSNEIVDPRPDKLKFFFQSQNSPLEPHADIIVQLADKYDLPWNLVPAIAGVESTFCRHIPENSFNCWGWANGKTTFTNYPTAVEIVSKALRERYYDRGLTTPELISPVYAPPSTTWAGKIRMFMEKIDQQPAPGLSALEITL